MAENTPTAKQSPTGQKTPRPTKVPTAHNVTRSGQLPPAQTPIILSHQSIGLLSFGQLQRRPNTAVVYATADGEVSQLTKPLTLMQVLLGPYRTQYEVYTGVQDFTTTTANDPLPAAEDRFSFSAKIEIQWHVDNAEIVVRKGIMDGQNIARRHVIERLRKISRRHAITQCRMVEEEINALTLDVGIPIEYAGILVDRVTAQVTLDDAAGEYLRRRTEIERASMIEQLQQPRARAAQAYKWELELDRVEAVARALAGDFGLIAIHLDRHPDDTSKIIEMIHARQQELEKRHDDRHKEFTSIFQKMVDSGFIQNADATEIRTAILNQTIGTVGPHDDGIHQYDGDIGLLLRKNPVVSSAETNGHDGPESADPVAPPPNGANVNGWRQRRIPPTAGDRP